jgi:hypothetical protein
MQALHGSDKSNGLSAYKSCGKPGHSARGGIGAATPGVGQKQPAIASVLKSLGIHLSGQAGQTKKAKKC